MKILLILLLIAYSSTWITGFYMTKKNKIKECRTIHYSLSLVT